MTEEEEVSVDRGPHAFSADRPIASSSEDRLGRAEFATAVAGAISGWTHRDSLVVALYGPWGSGKTSIKNMLLDSLASSDRRPSVLEFTPWQWAAQDQVASAFFEQLALALGRTDRSKEGRRRAAKWRKYAAYLKVGAVSAVGVRGVMSGLLVLVGLIGVAALVPVLWLRAALAVIGGVALALAAVLRWGGAWADAWASALAVRAEAEAKELNELKEELSGLLRELDRPLLVVIDDIDRLTPPEIRLLFQLLKANADFPNLVYLLLFERDMVERSLDTDDGTTGQDYLEKIVQVGFDVPRADRPRLERVLFESLDELLAMPGVAKRWDRQRWATLLVEGIRPIMENLRDVRRFSAMLGFHISLLRVKETFEVNPIDLIGLEMLRVFEPDAYQSLPATKDFLTRQPGTGMLGVGTEDEQRSAVTALVDGVDPSHRDAVRAIVKELFPPAGRVFGSPSYSGFEERWLRDLRVCHPDVFDRYFVLAIPEQDISQAEIDGLLASAGDRDAVVAKLRSLEERGLLEVALDRLEAYKQELDLEHAVPFITAVLDIGDGLADVSPDLFGTSPAMHAVRIVHWYLMKEQDSGARGAILKEAVADARGLVLSVEVVSLEDRRGESSREPDAFATDEADLPELKALCLNKIRQAAQSGLLQRHPRMKYILYRWQEWSPGEEVGQWVRDLVATWQGLLDFLRGSVRPVRSIGEGQYLAEERREVNLKEIEDFIPLEAVRDAVGRLAPTDPPPDVREVLDSLHKALQRRAAGKPDEEWDLP